MDFKVTSYRDKLTFEEIGTPEEMPEMVKLSGLSAEQIIAINESIWLGGMNVFEVKNEWILYVDVYIGVL